MYTVDLASQMVLSMAEHFMTRTSPEYPVGRARLEALGVIGCAFIMSMASLEVIQYSASDLYAGFVKGNHKTVMMQGRASMLTCMEKSCNRTVC